MKNGSILFLISLLCLVLPNRPLYAQSSIDENVAFGATFHVTSTGVATNSGLNSANGVPLYRALELAQSQSFGTNVKVFVYPGVHRQFEPPADANNQVFAAHHDFLENDLNTFPVNAQPGLLLIEGTSSTGDVIISGADDWTGLSWTSSGANFYRAWTNNWGETGFDNEYVNATSLGSTNSSLLKRRELFVLNGKILEQRLSQAALIPGSFFVDETADRIYIQPPSGTTMNTAKLEVGMRKSLLDLRRKNKVVIRNLVFQHAAGYISEAGGGFSPAVNVGGFGAFRPSQFLMDNCRFQFNGSQGLGGLGRDFTIRNSQFNSNGLNGMNIGGWYGLVENCVVLENNWRGFRSGYLGDTVGAIKGTNQINVTYDNVQVNGNYTKGLWFDVGCRSITVKNSVVKHNAGDGIYFEIDRGPSLVENTEIRYNRSSGIVTNHASSVVVKGCTIDGNIHSQFIFPTNADRSGTHMDPETNQTINWSSLTSTNYEFSNNVVTSRNPFQAIYRTSGPNWSSFLSSFIATGNTYKGTAEKVFVGSGGVSDRFAAWLALVGRGGSTLDPTATSTYAAPSLEALNGGSGKAESQSWYGAGGGYLTNLLNDARFRANVPESRIYSTRSEFPGGISPGSGARIRGIITAPTTGTYRFYISARIAAELKMSTDTNPANAVKIAEVTTPTVTSNRPTYLDFDRQAGQTVTRILTAGQQVYFEALTVLDGNENIEGHLAVAWQRPGTDTSTGLIRELIGSSYLASENTGGTFNTAATGMLLREFWDGMTTASGNPAVSELQADPRYPGQPSGRSYPTSFEGPRDMGFDGGARWRGNITAPATGSYTFWITSSGQSELWLSTNSSPANITKIAEMQSFANHLVWDKYSGQKSVVISLTAGQVYYVEVLHRYKNGPTHLEVGWSRPSQNNAAPSEVIPTSVLSPVQPQTISLTSPNGGEIYMGGSMQNTLWTSLGILGNVDIEFSSNNGSSWSSLVSNTANDGSQSVTFPNATSTQCRVRVKTVAGGSISGSSSSAFTLIAPTYTISGNITLTGNGLNGATVSDGTRTTTTNSTGNYTLINVPQGSYTITPSLAGYSFSPVNRTLALSGNLVAQDFTGISQPATYESFNYTAGTGALASKTGGANWSGAWDAGANDINATGSTYTSSGTLVVGGGKAILKDGVASFRSLPATYSTGTYWISFLAKSSLSGSYWGGLSLYDTNNERLFIGQRFGQSNWGLERSGVPGVSSSSNTGTTTFVVAKIVLQSGTDNVYLWVNPALNTTPTDGSAAQLLAVADFSFNRIRLQHGLGGGQTMEMDEIRLGTSYAEVAPIVSLSTGIVTFRSTNGLAANGSQDSDAPAGDGVRNIIKYAFNMIGTGTGQASVLTSPNSAVVTANGIAGLPLVDMDGTGKLRITLIRRKSTSNSGISSTVELSDTLANGSWAENASATTVVTSIDTTFERVVVTDNQASANKRFVRVKVTVP